MKSSVKFILIFALLMLSFSVRGEVMAFTELFNKCCFGISLRIAEEGESSSDSSSDSSSKSSSKSSILSNTNGDKVYDDNSGVHLLSFSDVELGFNPFSETYSFNSQRMRRAVELSGFFKGLLHGLCLRENLLVLDKSKSYHSDEEPYIAQSGCAYYVFALRRILI